MSVSNAEKAFLEDGVVQGLRADGRDCLDSRPLCVDVDLIPSASGSARIQSADADVVVCVKCTMGPPPRDAQDEGTLVLNIDCMGCVNVEVDGWTGDDVGPFLTTTLMALCLGRHVLDYKRLCVEPGHFAWSVAIDATVLNAGGNLLDVVCLGIKGALMNCRLPVIVVGDSEDAEDGDKDFEVDEREESAVEFPHNTIPLCVTMGLICGRCVLDMTPEEEFCSSAKVTVAVNEAGRSVGVHRSGRRPIELGALPPILRSSEDSGLKKHLCLRNAIGALNARHA
eukprot:Selendium_serpulae@DN1654_c0_g1_i1.p1